VEPAEILEKAADLYESEQIDWCQGQAYGLSWPKGMVSACAMGAIYLASGYKIRGGGYVVNNPREVAAHDSFRQGRRAIHELEIFLDPECSRTVAGWNDQPERTKEEVIQAMKDCAKDLRNKA
jgi:hypothetical protein